MPLFHELIRELFMRMAYLALSIPAICLAQAQGQPRLVIDAMNYDFGEIAPGAKVTHRFKASNAGTAPLTIVNLNPSCGCTSTLLGKKVLAPGESTELEVSFNSIGQSGTVHKSVQVVSDDPANPNLNLTFVAEILPGVIANTKWVLFPDLVRTDHRKAVVKFRSSTGQPIHATDVTLSEAPWLGVTTREVDTGLWVEFELLAQRLPMGKLTGIDTVDVHVVNPAPSIINLSVRWDQRPPVVITPEKVTWVGTAGRELSTTVVLRHRESKAFRIINIRTSQPLLKVTGIAAKAATTQTFKVVLSADAEPGTQDNKVFVTLDTPGHPELEIRVLSSLL
jgi:hypothetical protein